MIEKPVRIYVRYKLFNINNLYLNVFMLKIE